MMKSLLALASGLFGLVLCAEVSAAPTTSPLAFRSSDLRLEQAFAWAKAQALAYAHDGSDSVGVWYEAALPGRRAFCMRDVAHQAQGATALGLDEANLNMLRRFAAAVAPERDWAGYWEIDITGNPAPVDYTNDQDFWYNLPANFDVLDAIVRMWAWTGDDTYLTDPQFVRFFRTAAKEYVEAWDLEPRRVLARPRIMNRRTASGRDIEARGIPSYIENRDDFNVGVDLLAAEYRAFMDLAFLAERDNDLRKQQEYLKTAKAMSELIEKRAWSPEGRHYHGLLSSNGVGKGSGDKFVLHFGATANPDRIRGVPAYLKSRSCLDTLNIEGDSYLPKIFFLYGEQAAAIERILALSDPARPRRTYPEVSFAVIDAIVTGLMGIEAPPESGRSPGSVRTISRQLDEQGCETIENVHIRGGVIDVSHVGHSQTSFRNRSSQTLRWQAEFTGAFQTLWVNGKPMRARMRQSWDSRPLSFVVIDVGPSSQMTVRTKWSSSIDGEVVPLDTAGDKAVYEFIPIEVRCDHRTLSR